MSNQNASTVASVDHIVRLSLPVWAAHDDPNNHCGMYPEDRHWVAVAAENEDQARALVAAFYDGEAPRDEWDWKTAFEIRGPIETKDWPQRLQPQYPQEIRNSEALRLMGWREEGESECESCGLAAMGIKEYELCDDCYCCKMCCECPKRCELCDEPIEACACDETQS